MKVAETMKEIVQVHEREQDRCKMYADQSRRQFENIQVGDQVMVKTRTLSNVSQGITSKLIPKKDGPEC